LCNKASGHTPEPGQRENAQMTELVKALQPPPQLNEAMLDVTLQMRLIMMPFVTPLVRQETDGATHIGSGGYVEADGQTLLLTNDHVVAEGRDRLTHTFFDSEDFFPTENFEREQAPTDLAAALVDLSRTSGHSAMAFPQHRIAARHAPVKGEWLFMMGFAGKRAYYSPTMKIMLTNGTPYLTQEFDVALEERPIEHKEYRPEYHFAIPWEPENIDAVDNDEHKIPIDSHGFSGSLVWNTRFKEYGEANKLWEPGVAQLTGIIWGWPTNGLVLLATRIEFVTKFLTKRGSGKSAE
jgi:hypothetical protein